MEGYQAVVAYEALSGEDSSAFETSDFIPSAEPEAVQIPLGRDWNEEYQRKVDSKDLLAIRLLEREFSEHVCTLAPWVVRYHLGEVMDCPFSITALQRGTAGGRKYIAESVFFKLAVDFRGLYGGDAFAAKSAGREFRSIRTIRAMGDDLRVPLCTLVDFGGFRLIAQAVLPISDATLCYGSTDGGVVVVNRSKKLARLMTQVGEQLNLKPHLAGVGKTSRKQLHMAGDVEGHAARDGRFYCIDAARLMPPEAPSPFLHGLFVPCSAKQSIFPLELTRPARNGDPSDIRNMLRHDVPLGKMDLLDRGLTVYCHKPDPSLELNVRASGLCLCEIRGDCVVISRGEKASFLFELLRPEHVKKNHVPLSSDAFSAWGAHKQEIHNAEVAEATNILLFVIIPRFARELSDGHHFPLPGSLSSLLHARGIPVRFLGKIRSLILANGSPPVERLRAMFLEEMIVRVCKVLLRERLRLSKASEWNSRIVDFFNLLLGNGEASCAFWATRVLLTLLLKFGRYGIPIDVDEASSIFYLRGKVSFVSLFQRLQASTGVKLVRVPPDFFEEQPDPLFHVDDVISVFPCPKKYNDDNLMRGLDADSVYGAKSWQSHLHRVRACQKDLSREVLDDIVKSASLNLHSWPCDASAGIFMYLSQLYSKLGDEDTARSLLEQADDWMSTCYGGKLSAFGGGHPALVLIWKALGKVDRAEALSSSFPPSIFQVIAGETLIDKLLLSHPSGLRAFIRQNEVVRPSSFGLIPLRPRLFSCGKGEFGRLGVGDSSDQLTPVLLKTLLNETVLDVICGDWFTVVIVEDCVMTFGANTGQFGNHLSKHHFCPTPVPGVRGKFHAFAVSENQSNALIVVRDDGSALVLGELAGGITSCSTLLELVGDCAIRKVCRDQWYLLESGAVMHEGDIVDESFGGDVVVDLVVVGQHPAALTRSGRVYVDVSSFQWKRVKLGADDHPVVQLASSRHTYMALTNAGTVWLWERDLPPQMVHFAEPVFIVYVACGIELFACVDDKGRAYTWGKNHHGQLGHGHRRSFGEPTCVKLGVPVARVACGSSHTLFLTGRPERRSAPPSYPCIRSSLDVKPTPSNARFERAPSPAKLQKRPSFYELQMLRQMRSSQTLFAQIKGSTTQVELDGFEACACVTSFIPAPLSLSLSWTVLLTSAGEVFTLGRGNSGSPSSIPQPVIALKGKSVVQVAVSHHVACIESTGVLYTWGANESAQLGLGGPTISDLPSPLCVRALLGIRIQSVACGTKHTICAGQGLVFSWGCNAFGRLGHGNDVDVHSPLQIKALKQHHVVQVAAGDQHSIVRLDTGKCFAFGNGRRGALGLGLLRDQMSPRCIEGLHAWSIACGFDHSLFLVGPSRQEAGVFICGGMTSRAKPVPLEGLHDIVAIHGGYRCTTALSKTGELWFAKVDSSTATLIANDVYVASCGMSHVYIRSRGGVKRENPVVQVIPSSPLLASNRISHTALTGWVVPTSPRYFQEL